MTNKRVSAEEWTQRAATKNLEWVGEPPRRADAKTSIRCLKCGHEWDVQPNGLRKISMCPKCMLDSQRLDRATWIERVQKVDATWVSETPERLSDKTKSAKCNRCGQTWAVDPRTLYLDRGHPRCPKKPPTRARITNWEEIASSLALRFESIPQNANEKVPVECLTCGLTWIKRAFDIKKGSGCPNCARKNRANRGRPISATEWQKRASKVGLEWVGNLPQNASSKTRARCMACGYEFDTFPSNVSRGHGCSRCAGKSLAPEVLVARAREMRIRLREIPAFASSKVNCECEECGHVWRAAIATIGRGNGCPACAVDRRRERRRKNDESLDELGASLGFVWLEYPPNSRTPARAKCNKCGHIWRNLSSSATNGSSCPQCAGTFVSEDEWQKRAKAAKITWLEIPSGARIPTFARCLKCGLEWRANPGHISKGTGCPACAEYGFNVQKAAFVYFLSRGSGPKGRAARKVGISNVGASKLRLAGFKKLGFVIMKTWEFEEGAVAAEVEYEFLSWIRYEVGLPQELDREEMPIGGATETFSHGGISDAEAIDKINEIVANISANR